MNIENLLKEEFDEEKDIKHLKIIFNEMKGINEQYLDCECEQIEFKWILVKWWFKGFINFSGFYQNKNN